MLKAILRITIGVIFIISGFVKAIDTKGFSFKLEEYFSPAVFNIQFLEQYALPIAIAVAAAEIILGLMLILKINLKKTLTSLILLCVFFAFLTFYSAYFNKVTDCGCFGDAIKFTPWQSFYKDIFLLVGLVLLWIFYKGNFAKNTSGGCIKSPLLWLGILCTAFVIYWGNAHEPLIDFRDYKIGKDLKKEMEMIAKNPDEYKTFYVLKNKNTNEEKKVNQDDYVNDKSLWEEGSPWEIQSDKTISEVVKKGYSSEIKKFKLEDENGIDKTNEIINLPKVVLVFSYKPNEITALQKDFVQTGTPVFGVSTLRGTFTKIPNLIMDETAIKTIARSNPFVVTLQNGKILEKKSLKDYLD